MNLLWILCQVNSGFYSTVGTYCGMHTQNHRIDSLVHIQVSKIYIQYELILFNADTVLYPIFDYTVHVRTVYVLNHTYTRVFIHVLCTVWDSFIMNTLIHKLNIHKINLLYLYINTINILWYVSYFFNSGLNKGWLLTASKADLFNPSEQ